MKQAELTLEPPVAKTRSLRVTEPRHETACAAAPQATAQECRESDLGAAQQATATDHKNASAPSPAGPRSRAARIIALARALGVQSDAEAAGQLGDVPF